MSERVGGKKPDRQREREVYREEAGRQGAGEWEAGTQNQCAEAISTTRFRTRPLAKSSRAPPSTSASAPSVSTCGRGRFRSSGFWPDSKRQALSACHIQVDRQAGVCLSISQSFP
jgi:hypothetical protein